MERPTAAFSAPGKVLLAGGYLVLDRNFSGLVCGLDARIHVHVQTLQTSPGLTLSEIIVRSPQFRDAEWRYGYRETEEDGGIEVTPAERVSFYFLPSSEQHCIVLALCHSPFVEHLNFTAYPLFRLEIMDLATATCAMHTLFV